MTLKCFKWLLVCAFHRFLSSFSFFCLKLQLYCKKKVYNKRNKKIQGYKRDFMEGKEIFRTLKFLDCNHLQLIETESFFFSFANVSHSSIFPLINWVYHLRQRRELNFKLSHSTIVINNIVVYVHYGKISSCAIDFNLQWKI